MERESKEKTSANPIVAKTNKTTKSQKEIDSLGIILQKHHHFIPSDILGWFDRCYPIGLKGWVILGFRKKGTDNIYPLYIADRNTIRSYLTNMHVSKGMDYYITANSFFGNSKKTEQLWQLSNIVLDVDAHSENQLGYDLMEKFLWRLDKDLLSNKEIPVPTSIINTGRGLQLWWNIEPTSSKCLRLYRMIVATLSDAIDRFLNEYPNELFGFKVDNVASKNPAGYCRLPGTWNTKAGKSSVIIRNSDRCYSFQAMIDWANNFQQKAGRFFEGSYPNGVSLDQYSNEEMKLITSFETVALYRIKQLIDLRKLRDSEPGNETRNNFCHVLYSTSLKVHGPEAAWKQLKLFNAGFKVPMTDSELHNSIDHATKLGGYKFTNATIIDILNITEEEQRLIGLFPTKKATHESDHPARKMRTQMERGYRELRILDLYKQGKKQSEICRELEVSRPTVNKVLKENGLLDCSAKENRRMQAKELLEKGKTVREISDALAVSEQTIRNYKKSLKL